MKNRRLNLEEIKGVANEIIEGYGPQALPTLEQISWAFPIEGRDRVYYMRRRFMNRVPNTQEGNAMYQLMVFKNFHNVLTHLAEGRAVGDNIFPHHTIPVGDADESALGCYADRIHPNAGFHGGYFWDNASKELITAVLKTERIGRGKIVDAQGNEIHSITDDVYSDKELTIAYLANMRKASEIGRAYLAKISKSKRFASKYPQLVLDAAVESWEAGSEFQLGHYIQDQDPGIMLGKVISNNGRELEVKTKNSDESEYGQEIEKYEADFLKKFKGELWRLVSPNKIR